MSSSRHLPDLVRRSTHRPAALPNRLERATRRAETEVAEAGLDAWVDSEIDRLESIALGRAVEAAADIEFEFYDRFRAKAGNSAVKNELLARKLEILSRGNDERLRRFR